MKNKVKHFGLILFLMMLMSACAPDRPTKETVIPIGYSVKETDQIKSFKLHPGESLIVVLDGYSSTDDAWVVKSVDNPVLSLDGEDVFTPESSQLVDTGKTTIPFTTVHPGSKALILIYQRPFEKDIHPLKTFMINVTVAN